MTRGWKESISEDLLRGLLGMSVCAAAGLTGAIFVYMMLLAVPVFSHGHGLSILLQDWAPLHGRFGIRPMIGASLLLSFCVLVLAVPISLGCAAFVSVFAPRLLSRLVRGWIHVMTGVPTVIYGFVGVFVLVPWIRNVFEAGSGRCLLSAVLMLTLMVTPTMALFFIDAMESIPKEYGLAASALGAGPAQRLLYVILPWARPGLVTGILLAFGRAFGDTLISLMLAGNAAVFPSNLLQSARTLTAHIALVIAADFHSLEFASIFACGVAVYAVNAGVAMAAWKIRSRAKGIEP